MYKMQLIHEPVNKQPPFNILFLISATDVYIHMTINSCFTLLGRQQAVLCLYSQKTRQCVMKQHLIWVKSLSLTF